jgi:hypothetical protein
VRGVDHHFSLLANSRLRSLPPKSLYESVRTRLKFLHPESSLSQVKLVALRRLSTDTLKASLLPGQRDALKARPDGTLLDGHHRIVVLREREVDVDALPRQVVLREE